MKNLNIVFGIELLDLLSGRSVAKFLEVAVDKILPEQAINIQKVEIISTSEDEPNDLMTEELITWQAVSVGITKTYLTRIYRAKNWDCSNICTDCKAIEEQPKPGKKPVKAVQLKDKKITMATVKSFVKNSPDLLIKVGSRFNGMTDGVDPVEDEWRPAHSNEAKHSNEMGLNGAWFVGRSNDYLSYYNDKNIEGIQVTNSCGRFIIGVKIN